jgi:uncharacterized membrane protein
MSATVGPTVPLGESSFQTRNLARLMHTYLPLVPMVFVVLAIVGGLVIAALQIGVISHAYEKMGVSEGWVTALLLGSLLGSYMNIRVAELGGGEIVTQEDFSILGVHHVLPVKHDWPGTVLAVNVGGAIIPLALSIYLMAKNKVFGKALIGIAIVAVVVYFLATPIKGKGIAVPIFVPPILSAFVAMLLSRPSAAPLAYISGTLGTLVGADLMNLHRMAELGAPIASIGGAGTFDGIFLTGLLAVLLAH